MILIPYSYNGTIVNKAVGSSTDYDAYFERSMANLQMQTNPYYTKRAGAVPVYAGKDYLPATITLQITLQHDYTTLEESINQLFDTKDETPRLFVCIDTEDSNKQYYVYATPKQVSRDAAGGPNVTIILAIDDPIWQSVTQNSQTWTIASSTSTTDVVNNGNDYAFPIFEITPASQPSTDYAYGFSIQVVPQSTYPWPNRFLDITGSTDTTFDTAALVAAGKMQASGNDLRVFRDGVEVDRWLDGMNTTDTHVIVTCDMPPQRAFTLKTAIGSTDTVTEIEFDWSYDDFVELNDMPESGRVVVCSSLGSTDTEEFTYSSKTSSGSYPNKIAVTVESRAVRNTIALAHAAGALVYHVPYDFSIFYGSAGATAPVTDDTKKPTPSLSSRNWSFIYSNFFNLGARRPNAWYPYTYSSSRNPTSKVYTSTNDEGDTDPATALGVKAESYSIFGVWQPDTIDIGWSCFFGDAVSSLAANGVQKQNTDVIPIMQMMGRAWYGETASNYLLFTISPQSSTDYGTFTTWNKASTDSIVYDNTMQLVFSQSGQIYGTTDNYNKVEADSITVGLRNYPDVRLRIESGNVSLNIKIKNETTGEFFFLNIPTIQSETVTVDTNPDFPTVIYKGATSNGSLSLSSIRAPWLMLAPGTNTLSFENNLSALFDLNIVIKWSDRVNYL